MKRLLLTAAFLLGLASAAEAACPSTTAVMKDNVPNTYNMGMTSDPNGNCASYNSIVAASGALVAGSIVDITNLTAPLNANTATATKSLVVGGQYLSTQPTMTNTQQAGLLTSSRGELLVAPGVSGFNVTNAGTFLVQAAQSGAWNITNITGTVSLPTGAATAANQPTNTAAGSTTSGQTGMMNLAAVTTASPSYTTGQSNFLSLTLAGALRVDASATTQPVSNAGTFAVQLTGATNNINNITGTVSLPTGAATAANQATAAAQGSATSGQTGYLAQGAVTTGSPAYTTAQTSPFSLTTAGALRVDASATTQPVSIAAAVTVSQATAGNLNATVVGNGTFAVQAAQSGNWTSRIVGNAAAILDFAGQNATGTINAQLVGGQFNTSPTTITSGNFSPFQLDANGNLLVNVKVGGGTGGTSSTFGATFPTVGTAIGMSQGGNMVALNGSSGNLLVSCANCSGSGVSTVDEATWTAGTSLFVGIGGAYQTTATSNPLTSGQQGFAQLTINRALHINLRNSTGTEIGTAATPVQVSLANTTANGAALLVTGTGGTFPVTAASGAYASGSLASGAVVDITNLSTPIAPNTATATKGILLGMQFNSTQATFTTGQQGAVQGTSRGALYVAVGADGFAVTNAGTFAVQLSGATNNINNISGTISLPTGAATSANQPTNVAQASTTSGQTGTLLMGAVTTGSPAYTTAQTDPLSLTTAGALRVDASATTQPVSIAAAVTVAQATAGNLNATVVNAGTFAVQATLQASATTAIGKVDPNTLGNWGLQVSTQNSATPTNGGLVLGQFNTSPTTITSGNVSPLQLDSAARLIVNCQSGCGGSGGSSLADKATFTFGTTSLTVAGGVYNTTPSNLTSGQGGAFAATADRFQIAVQGLTTAALTAWTSATTVNSTQVLIPINGNVGSQAVLIQLDQTTTITGGAVTFQGTYDGTNWVTIPTSQVLNPNTFAALTNPYTFVASTNQPFLIMSLGYQSIRINLTTVITGTGSVTPQVTLLPNSALAWVANTNPNITPGDAISTTTYGGASPTIGVGLLWNGTTYDRQKEAGATGIAMVGGGAAAGSAVSGNPVLVGGTDGTNARSVSTDSAGHVNTNGGFNVTPTDCSTTITTGGTAQNAITAQTTLHGFTIANIDSTTGSGEPLWISFTTTAAASTAGSYPLAAPTATTFAGLSSYSTPPGFGTNHAVSVIGATTGHKFSCTWW